MANTQPDAAANAALDAALNGTYLALLTAVISGAAGTFTESADPGYARQAISWAAAAGRAKAPTADITFPAATQANPDITHVAIMSALTLGTAKDIVQLGTPIPYGLGVQPTIASDAISASVPSWTG